MTQALKIIVSAAMIAMLGAGCGENSANDKNNNAAPKPPGFSRANPASENMTVNITAAGDFEPTTAFVKKGTIVTFTNGSQQPAAIVGRADQNGKLEALDSKKEIGPGESFSAAMDRTGRWFYVNGNNQAFSGAVEVLE